MFHHTATRSGLCVVFTALALARHLQNTTGHSIRKIIRTLRPLSETITT